MGILLALTIAVALSCCSPQYATAQPQAAPSSKAENNSSQSTDEKYSHASRAAVQQAIKFNNKGVDLFTSGKYNDAIKQWNEAIRLNPRYTEAYSNRGAAFDALNNPERAMQDYTAAIELSPKLTAAYSNRAAAYTDLGNYKAAVSDWNVVIQRSPRDAHAFTARGICRQALGDLPAALKDFDKALAINPHDAKAAKNRDAVKKSMQTQVSDASRSPQAAGAPGGRGAVNSSTAPAPGSAGFQPAPASAVPTQSANTNSNAASRSTPEACAPKQGGPGCAPGIVATNTNAAAPPAKPDTEIPGVRTVFGAFQHIAGNFWFAVGQYPAAIDRYSAAIADNPTDAFAFLRRGNAYAAAGMKPLALADFQQACQLAPRLRQARTRRDRLAAEQETARGGQ